MKANILLIGALIWASVQCDPVPKGSASKTDGSATANRFVKHLYQMKSFEFEDGSSQSVSVADFDYDPYTGYLCAAFKRLIREQTVPTVACFDVTKYKPQDKVIFSAFPTLMDNMRPDQESLTLGRSNLLVAEDDAGVFDKKPATVHLQRLWGRSSRASKVKPPPVTVVSEEHHGTILEGNENHRPTLQDPDTPDLSPVQRNPYNFISVTKIHFDDCGRMWFLDCGTAFGDAEPEKHFRRPILWSFELVATEDRQLLNKLFLRYEITTNMTHNGISDFVIDIHGNKCEDFHVYMANHKDNNIIVYSHKRRWDYAMYDESLSAVPSEQKHLFQGQEYDFSGGVFSLSLAALNENGFRDLFYTLGSGTGEYAVSTKSLRRKTDIGYFRSLGYRGCAVNSLNHVYDTFSKVMFYMHPETKSVRCWNTNKRLIPDNIGTVFVDDKLATGWSLKIDQSNNLWFMANDFNYYTQKRVEGGGGVDALNIYRGKVKEIIQNTVCDEGKSGGPVDSVREEEEDESWDQYVDTVLQSLFGGSSSVEPGMSSIPSEGNNNNKPSPSDIMNIASVGALDKTKVSEDSVDEEVDGVIL